MPTIAFISSKGGVGKTTTAFTLASVLSHFDQPTTLIDADPNAPLMRWAQRFPDAVPSNLTVVASLGPAVAQAIEDAKAQTHFVVVDLEGSKNREVPLALDLADLILIPMKGHQLDCDEALNIIKLIRSQEKILDRKIPYKVFLSMTSPIIVDRAMVELLTQLRAHNVPLLKTEMTDRAAFRLPFSIGGTLYELTKKDTRNPEIAVENAEAFAGEVRDSLVAAFKQAAE
jgi:chromosome partitioning protein